MSAPISNAKRFDRQLRVWGAVGQAKLEQAHVGLLGCGATGTETLKNLVLGNLGSFTAVDGASVTQRDLGNNFMVTEGHLGSSRAQSCTQLLKELNENVNGAFIEADVEELIRTNPDFFKPFTLVIAAQLAEPTLFAVERLCRDSGVPLLAVRSYGMVGTLRPSFAEHVVLDTRPTDVVYDLRLHDPWPKLAEHAAAQQLATMDDIAHKHVPYAVLLIQAAQQWRAAHGGVLPQTYPEKTAFKEGIRSMQRKVEDMPLDEENFDEAFTNAFKVWAPPDIPREISALMESESAQELTVASSPFWLCVAALREFVRSRGTLPLPGSLPDMTATTAGYLTLCQIYAAKAEEDVAAMQTLVQEAQAAAGHTEAVPVEYLRRFCKCARTMRVVSTPPLSGEGSPASDRPGLRNALSAEDSAANASLFVLLRAAHQFRSAHGRYPAAFPGSASSVEADLPLLKSLVGAILTEGGAAGCPVSDDLAAEVCRFGAGELHAVAAVMGGAAAQEAIKHITEVFVPMDGTLVYNAMAGTSTVLQL